MRKILVSTFETGLDSGIVLAVSLVVLEVLGIDVLRFLFHNDCIRVSDFCLLWTCLLEVPIITTSVGRMRNARPSVVVVLCW